MTTATHQAAAPSLDAILTAPAVVVPGIARWLGYTDDQQSLDEDFEDYCNRISKEAP
jgi:hypothetical protein